MTAPILVAGGGIGGLALALALDRVGRPVEVYEARPRVELGAGGAFLNLAPNGVNALAELGLADDVAARGYASTGIEFLDHRGRRVGQLDATNQLARYAACNMMLRRADLHELLHDAVRDADVPFYAGHRVVSVREMDAGVHVSFTDGTRAQGAMLIGCDGVRSRVRTHVVGPRPTPRYLGLVDVAGFSTAALPGVVPGPQWMVFGRRAFFGYYVTPACEVWWFSNVPRRTEPARHELEVRPPEEWLTELRAAHRDDPPEVDAILAHSSPPVGAWPVTDLAFLPTWHTRRVCLLGDAAHATSPSAGQGASLAIEDAIVLAGHLAKGGTAEAAFAAFERERRPRVESLIRSARRNSTSKIPGPVGTWFRDQLLPLFLRLGARSAANAYGYRPAPLPTGRPDA